MPLFRNNHEPPATQRVLAEETVKLERKAFTAALCENHLGRFVRLTENVNGRLDHIVIPWTGLAAVRAMLARVSRIETGPNQRSESPPKEVA